MLSHQTCLLVHTHAYQDPSAHIFILSLSSNATKSFLFSVMIKKPNKDPIKCCNNAATTFKIIPYIINGIKTSPPCIIMRSRPPPLPFPSLTWKFENTKREKNLLLSPPPPFWVVGVGGWGRAGSGRWLCMINYLLLHCCSTLLFLLFFYIFLSNLTGLHQTKI